ncbi:6-bladed beta-propeller, partial [Bacteroides fragilis]
MRQKSLLLLLPFLLLSCGGKKNSGQLSDTAVQIVKPEFPQIVPFETGIETEQEILLSEIADSIRYIPLETNNKCLIRGLKGSNIIRTKEYFFLPWIDKLFQYTKDGKFIRTLGRKGGGPGEFNWIMQIDVDEKKGLVYMLTTTGKINIYSMETGKFIRAMKVPNIEVSEFAMLRVQDTIAATFMRNNNGKRKERIYLSNLKGDTLKIFNRWDLFDLNSKYRWMISSDIDRYMFHYKSHTCYKEYYNDTLFTITQETLEPRYIFQMGKYSLPIECRFEYLNGDGKRFQEVAAPYIQYNTI